MTLSFSRTAILATVIGSALAAPTAASAHPAVFFVTPQVSSGTPPTLAAGPVQYLVAQHGLLRVLRETNGVTDRGMLNYKTLPNPWRGTQTKATILALATGVQVHPTCQGLAALDEAAVLSWQDADPFYNYVPWTKTAAELDDAGQRDAWVAAVKDNTGVDLDTVVDPAAACTTLGGVFTPADATVTAGAAFASGDLAAAVNPLKLIIAELEPLAARVIPAPLPAAPVVPAVAPAKLSVAITQSDLGLAKIAASGLTVKVTGTPGTAVTIKAEVSVSRAKKLRIPATIATSKTTIPAAGSSVVTLKLKTKAAAKVAKATKSVPINVGVTSSATTTAVAAAKG